MQKNNPDDQLKVSPPDLSAFDDDQEQPTNEQPHPLLEVKKKEPMLKIQMCDSATNNFKQGGDSSSDDDNRREIVSNDSDEDLDLENDNENQKRQHITEDRLEEVSEQGSELFETDSSCGEGQEEVTINQDGSGIEIPIIADGEGRDIVAGSPTRVGRKVDEGLYFKDEQAENAKEEETEDVEEQKGREEMNGTIVYDSYAKLTGCEKIVQYYEQKETVKLNQSILFPKDETKEVVKEFFQEKAKERDFPVEYDRYIYRNLPKFLPQRDFDRQQFEIFVPQQQNVLIFDSRFENGNLRKVAKVNNIEYNLWLENDLNTKGHTQWYYFKVIYKDIALRADKKSHKIKFSILNLAKTSSLYQVGMKPCIWSKRKNQADGTEWFRGGEEISYTQNDIPRYPEAQGASYGRMQGNENNNNAFLYNSNGAGEGTDYYYTFSFKYEFEPNVDEELWFAHAVPSTYTDMQESLVKLRNETDYQSYMKMNILCLTLAKNPVPLITITENVGTYLDYYEELRLQAIPGIVKKAFRQKYTAAQKLAKQSEVAKGRVQRLLLAALDEELKQFIEFNESHLIDTSPKFVGFGQRLANYVREHSRKKTIFITSRVHPGEPQASHMLEGLLQYLLGPQAEMLRKHFVFRIVPMLNPDGVIYGNYRCSLLGCDLNRKWDKPNRFLHPPVFFSKMLIRHMHQERKVLLYCDLHGHSRKKNAFFYGCSYKNYEQEGRVKNAHIRLIPLLCCQKNELFKLKDCRFRMENTKQSTARCVVFKEFNIQNSFTLECSFYAKEDKKITSSKKQLNQLSIEDYNSMGHTLIQCMNSYLPSEQYKLQFLSGKILDVFYDEFIKFVPPYILKREEEKRKKAEEGPQGGQGKKSTQLRVGYQSRISNTMGEAPSVSQLSHVQRRQSQNFQQVPQHVGPSNLYKAETGKISLGLGNEIGPILNNKKGGSNVRVKEYNGNLTQQSELNITEGIYDGQSQFVKAPESPNTPMQKGEDILELESFMMGVQSNIRKKEAKKQAKKQSKVDGSNIEFSDMSSISGGSSGDDFSKSKKRKKKKANFNKIKGPQNTQVNLGVNSQTKKKSTFDVSAPKSEIQPNSSLKRPSNTNVNIAKQSFNNKMRSPRNFELVAPVLAKKASKQQIGAVKDQVMSSQQIQLLIQNQIQSGVLNQSEILSEIQKAIVHNQKVLTSGLMNQMQGEQQSSSNPNQQQDSIHNQQAALTNILQSFNVAQSQPTRDSRQKQRSTTTTFVMPNIEQDKGGKHSSLINSPNSRFQQQIVQSTSSTQDRRQPRRDNQGQNIANAMFQNAVASAEEEGDGMISPNFLGKKPSSRIYAKKNAQHESLPMIPATNSQLKSYNMEQKNNYQMVQVQSQQVSSSMQQYNSGINQINVNKNGTNYPQSAPMSDFDMKDINKVKPKFTEIQGSNASINMEINLNAGESLPHATEKHFKNFSYEPLDEVPFKNQGIKSKLETDFSPQLQRGEQNISYRTQKVQKDFKISRNIQTHNQQIQQLPGTFDSSNQITKQSYISNEVSMLNSKKNMIDNEHIQVQEHIGFKQPQSTLGGLNLRKSDFKNSSVIQSIKVPKKIKPILGLKNIENYQNTVQIQKIGGSQKQERAQRMNQQTNEQMGLTQTNQNQYMSPQGQLQGVRGLPHQTQIGFLPNNQYQIAKKRQEAMQKLSKNQKQEAKELFISGSMGRAQGMQDQYRRSSAGYDTQNQQTASPLLPPASKKNLQTELMDNKNTLQIVDMSYNKGVVMPQHSHIGSISEKVQRHKQMTAGMNQAHNQKKLGNQVMSDLQQEIAKETASMDLVQKQKQLQIQLEKQQKLLQQLQTQLNQQNGGKDGQNVAQQMNNNSFKQTTGQMLQQIPKEFVNFEASQYSAQSSAPQNQMRDKGVSMSQEWRVPFVGQSQDERGQNKARSKTDKYQRTSEINNNMNYKYKNNDHKQYNTNMQKRTFYQQTTGNMAQTRLHRITENTSNDFSNPAFSNKMLGSAPKTPNIGKNIKLDNKTQMQLSQSEFSLNGQQVNSGQKGNNKMVHPQSQRWTNMNQKQQRMNPNMQNQQMNNSNQQQQLQNDHQNDQNNEHQGISVANYVQNINVFVSENTQGAGRSIGLGIGQGIAGGLGNGISTQNNMQQQYAQINQNEYVLQENLNGHQNQQQNHQFQQTPQKMPREMQPRKESYNQKGGIQMSQIQPLIQNHQGNQSVAYETRSSVKQLGDGDPNKLVMTPNHKKQSMKGVNQTQIKFNPQVQNNNLMSPMGQYRGNPKLQ